MANLWSRNSVPVAENIVAVAALQQTGRAFRGKAARLPAAPSTVPARSLGTMGLRIGCERGVLAKGMSDFDAAKHFLEFSFPGFSQRLPRQA
jgi:hypothetical protein